MGRKKDYERVYDKGPGYFEFPVDANEDPLDALLNRGEAVDDTYVHPGWFAAGGDMSAIEEESQTPEGQERLRKIADEVGEIARKAFKKFK